MTVASAKIKRSDPYYDVKKRRDITPSAKNVYYALLSLQKTCEEVYPSHDWIADECGISRSTSIRAVAELHRLGFIIKTQRGSMKSNMYSVVLPADLPAGARVQGDVDEHDRDSKTECRTPHDDQNSHDPVEVGQPDVNPVSPADVVPELKAAPVPAVLPHLQGDDEFSIWCSVAKAQGLDIDTNRILHSYCGGDKDKAARAIQAEIRDRQQQRHAQSHEDKPSYFNRGVNNFEVMFDDEEEPEIPF
ncbi:helix-turn-helix domain-containing protein [Serratia proteamaculans]